MRRTIGAGALALALLAATHGTVLAQSIAGTWTATSQGQHLALTFKGAEPTYTGTFVTSQTYLDAKKVKRTSSSVQQLKAVTKVINKITTVTLTIQPPKGALLKTQSFSTCNLVKGALKCLAPFTQTLITFVPEKR